MDDKERMIFAWALVPDEPLAPARITFSRVTADRWYRKNHQIVRIDTGLFQALRSLMEACAYVRPIAGAVAVEASVKNIRQAGDFMKAMERAAAAIAKAEAKENPTDG